MSDDFDDIGQSHREQAGQGQGARDEELSFSDDLALTVAGLAHGGLVGYADDALAIAEVLLKRHYGRTELKRQRPLIVTDGDDRWLVEGSCNRERKPPDDPSRWANGPFFISLSKHDGRVLRFGRYAIPAPLPDEMLEELGLKKPGTKKPSDD